VRDAPDRDWKLTDRLDEITVPAVVVRGEHEVRDLVSSAELLATSLPSAYLVIVPSSGHLVPLEQPVATVAALTAFLAFESQ